MRKERGIWRLPKGSLKLELKTGASWICLDCLETILWTRETRAQAEMQLLALAHAPRSTYERVRRRRPSLRSTFTMQIDVRDRFVRTLIQSDNQREIEPFFFVDHMEPDVQKQFEAFWNRPNSRLQSKDSSMDSHRLQPIQSLILPELVERKKVSRTERPSPISTRTLNAGIELRVAMLGRERVENVSLTRPTF